MVDFFKFCCQVIIVLNIISCSKSKQNEKFLADNKEEYTKINNDFLDKIHTANVDYKSDNPILTGEQLSIILIKIKLHFLLNLDLDGDLEIAYIRLMNLVNHCDSQYKVRLFQKFPILDQLKNEFDKKRLKMIVLKYQKNYVSKDNYFFEKINVHYGWRNAKKNSLFIIFDTMKFEHAFPTKIELKSDFCLK